jgi:hypothetical protein
MVRIERRLQIAAPIQRCFDLSRSIEVHLSGTQMRDRFTFAAPIPILGYLAERLFLRRYMEVLLRNRNSVLKTIAESDRWQEFLPRM